MKICPNFNDPQVKQAWDAIESDPTLGRFEAMKEFLEAAKADRLMRTPEQVKKKIEGYSKLTYDYRASDRYIIDRGILIAKSNDPTFTDPATLMGNAILSNPESKKLSVATTSNVRAMESLRKISDQLGIPYAFVSPEEATTITGKAANPYNVTKGNAFFYNGVVNFVGTGLTVEQVFHEFSHPFVKHLKISNPILANKLYAKAIAADPSLLDEAYAEYADLKASVVAEMDPNNKAILEAKYEDALIEEVLVKAFTKAAKQKEMGIVPSTGFKKFITDLFYAIKQALRKIFGQKIKVSNLDTTTTLDELVDMLLEGKRFEINTDNVKESDVVNYLNENLKYLDDLRNITKNEKNTKILAMINKMYDAAKNQVRIILTNKDYQGLVDLFADEYNRGDLQSIRDSLRKHAIQLEGKAVNMINDIESTQNEMQALVNSLLRLEIMMKKMKSHLEELSKDKNNQANVSKAFYYGKVLNYWQNFIEEGQETIAIVEKENSGTTTPDAPLNMLLSSIQATMKSSEKTINDISYNGVSDVLWEQWKPLADRSEELFQDMIRTLKSSNTSQKTIDKRFFEFYGMNEEDYKDYSALKTKLAQEEKLTGKEKLAYDAYHKANLKGMNITPEKIDSNLKGQGKDAHWGNTYLEGYMYNTDPIIGGFAIYFKNNMSDMNSRVQARYNEIADELKPAMKAAGVNSFKIGELGKLIGFIDKAGFYNTETEQFEEKEIWTLLNPNKNYRHTLDKYNYDINSLRVAYVKSGSDEDRKALDDMIAEKNAHQRKYFKQEYVDEYYQKDDYFEKDAVGRQAAGLRTEILDEISRITHTLNNEYDVLKANDVLEDLWKRYALLHSLYYVNGDKKTNSYTDVDGVVHFSDQAIIEGPDKFNVQNDLAIAERLKEYKDYMRDFREWKERKGVFQEAFKNFEAETKAKLILLNYEVGSEAYLTRLETYLDEWLAINTKVVIKPEFYQRRSAIIAEIQEIYASVTEDLRTKLAKLRAENDPANDAKITQLEDFIASSEQKIKEIDFTKDWNLIHDVVSGYRDDDGQPNGIEIPQGRKDKVKAAQEAMEKARDAWSRSSALTKAEETELQGYYDSLTNNVRLDGAAYSRFEELKGKKGALSLSPLQRKQLEGLFEELRDLQTKQATDYYMDAITDQLSNIDTDALFKNLAIEQLNAVNVSKLYTPETLKFLFEQSPEFEKWFNKNHISREIFDKELGHKTNIYERLYVWNVVKPNDKTYYESTQVTHEDGRLQIVDGVPKTKYFSLVVKKKFRTGYDEATDTVSPRIGIDKDNQGMYLPKSKEEMQVYRAKYPERFEADEDHLQYVNEDYYKLQDEQPALAKVLEIITRHHLKTQEGLGSGPKLYLDFPRFEMSNLEWAQTGGGGRTRKEAGSKLGLLWKKITDFINGYQADIGSVLNWNEKLMLIRADAFNNEIESIPIHGLYKLTTEETSTDIVTSMLTYMASAENHKQLVKMNPVATAIKKVLNDEANAQESIKGINRTALLTTGMMNPVNSKDDYIRRQGFNNFYEREFEGKTQKGAGSKNAVLQNTQSLLFKMASFSFFALNIPSALKNAMSAKFQALIHSVTGTDMDPSSLIRGEAWSLKYMTKLSFDDAYGTGHKSLEHQIGEVFDPIDRFIDKFSESITRTLGKDIASLTWLSNFRKWTEVQAGMQTFAGMMYKKKVKQGSKNIDYMSAWELNPAGQITLKDGIDVRYSNLPTTYTVEEGDTLSSIAGKMYMTKEDLENSLRNTPLEIGKPITIDNIEFKTFRSRAHSVFVKLNGAYAKMDQPEMQRFMAFRYVSYLRKYFTTMALNRFGKKRWNPGYGEIDEGYYVTAVKALGSIVSNKGFHHLSPNDKGTVMKVITEVGSLYLLSMLVGLLWDWDDDDPDRFKKLRKRSGHSGFFGLTSENKRGEEFNFGGFMSLHAMNLMMQIRAENEQLVPLPGYGLNYMNQLLDFKSMSFGPTFDAYGKVASDIGLMMAGSDKQFYKRRVGPYKWQDKGSRKIWGHLAKTIGVTGTAVSPAQGITNWKNAENRF